MVPATFRTEEHFAPKEKLSLDPIRGCPESGDIPGCTVLMQVEYNFSQAAIYASVEGMSYVVNPLHPTKLTKTVPNLFIRYEGTTLEGYG